jgi:hypothetical protein
MTKPTSACHWSGEQHISAAAADDKIAAKNTNIIEL